MCPLMPGDGPKSSKDLIREANERLRGSPEDAAPPPPEAHPPVPSDPVTPEPRRLEYRSDHAAATDDTDTTADEAIGPGALARSTVATWLTRGVVRLLLAAVVFGGWYFFTSFNDADRDGSGEIVSAGQLDVMSLQVGDCFNDPEELEQVVFDVAAVPCSEPHDNEVFALMPFGSAFGDSYPGEATLDDYSYEVCGGQSFDSYVGGAYVDSSLEVFSFSPTEESWNDGDREFVCVLYRIDFGEITGTARGSGL
jgi:Septum formation